MRLSEGRSKKIFSFLSFLGVLILLVGGYFFFVKGKERQPAQEEVKKEAPLHTKGNPVRLEISGVKIDLPIIENKIVDGVWETTQEGVSHLDISGNPGEGGNIVLYGHNKRVLLGSLPYVSMGAKIKVVADDGQEYMYRVYSKRKVEADDISVALATPTETLTIYTCDELNTKRFVLQARPI